MKETQYVSFEPAPPQVHETDFPFPLWSGETELTQAIETTCASLPLDGWLRAFLLDARRVTQLLWRHGAVGQAAARETLIGDFLQFAQRHFEEELDTAEAASLLGVSEETIRRRYRSGELTARRAGGRGRLHFTRGELEVTKHQRSAGVYDPVGDAHTLSLRKLKK